nr:MAG TPA: hypothetical protein [Caudoviricetes sp.]
MARSILFTLLMTRVTSGRRNATRVTECSVVRTFMSYLPK